MTIYERALDFVPDGEVIGLGSGRAAWAFVRLLGERVRAGAIRVRGVPTSDETARLAVECGVPLAELAGAGELAVTVDGADEVDPNLDLIKGYGRALLREKVVAAASRRLVILVGQEKLVPKLGTRGKLPVEVVPFAVPLCDRKLVALGLSPVLWRSGGQPGVTDNGNRILDCGTGPIADPAALDAALHAVPGVAGTGLFVRMAGTVLVGDDKTFEFIEERTPSR
ncbi:ribose-5-phosphate isomerase RpiA [Gemmata sp.]|uniref:ribose-5-phosphate isomerase RpiA n=1 Tax=Gemmata sp. TaxID=1914242 RepID=UPI003F71002C